MDPWKQSKTKHKQASRQTKTFSGWRQKRWNRKRSRIWSICHSYVLVNDIQDVLYNTIINSHAFIFLPKTKWCNGKENTLLKTLLSVMLDKLSYLKDASICLNNVLPSFLQKARRINIHVNIVLTLLLQWLI